MNQLILASTSRYRQELLERLRLPFSAEPPGVDEDAVKSLGLTGRELAETLARMKAEALGGPARVVIGGDQLVHYDGKILGKPGRADMAAQMLRQMAGRTHEVITSVCVWTQSEVEIFTDVTRMTLRKLTEGEIARYIDLDQPLDCAGAYKIEKLGITLMEKIQTADFTAVQGLPLIKLSEVLRRKGFDLP